ncbi:MAG: hypothetical protein ACF8R7_16240 [Phycisphaerales bacterium JB039]
MRSLRLALASLAGCAPAWADSVDLTYLGRGAGQVVTVSVGGHTARLFAGELTYSLSGGDGAASDLRGVHTMYRREMPALPLRLVLGRSTDATRYQLGYQAIPFTDAQRDAVSEVLRLARGAGDAAAAAAQLAIWELAHDFGAEGVDSGVFRATVDSNLTAQVNSLLAAAHQVRQPASHLALGAEGEAGMITMVPLPAPALLGAIGLGGALLIARRRASALESR